MTCRMVMQNNALTCTNKQPIS